MVTRVVPIGTTHRDRALDGIGSPSRGVTYRQFLGRMCTMAKKIEPELTVPAARMVHEHAPNLV